MPFAAPVAAEEDATPLALQCVPEDSDRVQNQGAVGVRVDQKPVDRFDDFVGRGRLQDVELEGVSVKLGAALHIDHYRLREAQGERRLADAGVAP